MAHKGEQTRERIIHQSAALFNVHGYIGTAMSDIIEVTGIQKGGIYRHFSSKEEIALAALDYALEIRIAEVRYAVETHGSALDQLNAVSHTFLGLLKNNVIPGGCPILNTAIEADDTFQPLKKKAQEAMDSLRSLIHQTVTYGKDQRELQPYVNGDVVATILISTCEGALMMSKLYDDVIYLHRAIDHLEAYFDTLKS